MPEAVNRQFLLAARPHGMVKASDFEYREVAVPTPGPGEALIKTNYISLDPSMRGQMENRADYVALSRSATSCEHAASAQWWPPTTRTIQRAPR